MADSESSRRARPGKAVVDSWVADPARADADAHTPHSELADAELGESAPLLLMPRTLVAACVVTASGQRVWADARFDQWVREDGIDAPTLASVRQTGAPKTIAATDRDDHPLALAYLPARDAAFLMDGRTFDAHHIVIAAVSFAHDADPLIQAGRAHGLSAREARVAAALVRHGSLPKAAGACGASYSSARDAIASALRKSGAARQSELVSMLARHAGYIPADRDGARRALRDIFGLSEREAHLALLLSEGCTRSQAAAAAGMSEAVAKDVFERLFVSLGVSAAPQVSRVAAEAFAASMLTQAPEAWSEAVRGEPLRLIPRGDGGRIAISDFGPAGKRVVCIIHSSATTRHPARSFVRALQRAGYRPIAIDRPGFGLSDPLAAPSEPFEDAAHDMARVCDALRIDRLDLIARGGAHAALAFAHHYANRCGRVVALNPDTLVEAGTKREGILGAVKYAMWRHPEALEKVARIIAAQATPERTRKLIHASLRASAPDMAVFANPAELADQQRAVLMFATGRVSGFIAEQKAYNAGLNDPPLPDASNWTVLLGAHDPLHHVADMEAYWRGRLPQARFETLPDAGRFIHLSHPAHVIDALKAD